MILADFLPAAPDRSWALARQPGVNHAICKCAPELTGLNAPDDIDALRAIRVRFAEGGPKLVGLEGDEVDMPRIKLGLNAPVRMDHVPSLAVEEELPHGYATLARPFAGGHPEGILDAHRIPRL
jgi:hypothetical protein